MDTPHDNANDTGLSIDSDNEIENDENETENDFMKSLSQFYLRLQVKFL